MDRPVPPAHTHTKIILSKRVLGENWDVLKSAFLGLVSTALFYEVFPLPLIENEQVLSIFDSIIAWIITAMSAWCAFLFLLKYISYRREKRLQQAWDLPSIKQILAEGLYGQQATQTIEKIIHTFRSVGHKKAISSLALIWLERLLEHAKHGSNKSELHAFLSYQAHLESKKLENTYFIVQFFIWAIPILGFIGTVLGIGNSVGEFGRFIQGTGGIDAEFSAQVRVALAGVTSGLSVAFNTTFLALALVVPLMAISSILQKNEESLLLGIEEFCLERLLPQMYSSADERTSSAQFDAQLHRVIQLSNGWLEQIEPLIKNMTQRSEMLEHQMAGFQHMVHDLSGQVSPQASAAASFTAPLSQEPPEK